MASAFQGNSVRAWHVPTGREIEVLNLMDHALEKPWRNVVPKMLQLRGLLAPDKRAVIAWMRWMEPQLAKAPIPIVTVFDWFWWITYSCKFQFDLTRLFCNRSHVTAGLLASVKSFYHTFEWHQWSFHNHASKMKDKFVWASYKHPLKQWIYMFDGCHEYYAGKIKAQSANSPWGYQLAIDDRLNIINFGILSVSRRKMEEKYGQALWRFVEITQAEIVHPAL